MKERPILFSTPMVRALLAGTKTQTRRIVALREFQASTTHGYSWMFRDRHARWNDYSTADLIASRHNRYGVPGDRLWVRETWQQFDRGADTNIPPGRFGGENPLRGCEGDRSIVWTACYRADGEPEHPEHGPARWRPAIHMPRWASRISLEVTKVRVDRLCVITDDDARAEGVEPLLFERKLYPSKHAATATVLDHRAAFWLLWESINGAESWRSNPWVWVVEFKTIKGEGTDG